MAGQPPIVDMNDEKVAEQVELFGSLCATHKEMANWFGCTVRTIENYMREPDEDKGIEESAFFRVYKKAQAEAKTSLRRIQMQRALEGENVLLIWLGKQLLGQRDKVESENNNINTNIISAEPLTAEQWEEEHGK